MEDLSRLRQKVHGFNAERSKLLSQATHPKQMVQGSLYQMGRCCGNPNCKCAKGHKHVSWYLSRAIEGETKLSYIGRIVPDWLGARVGRYQRQQRLLARIRKIDSEISDLLNQLRDAMVQTIEEVWGNKGK